MRRFYRLRIDPDVRHVPREALVNRTRSLLADAVALRTRSDVPIGTMLSGGLDSTSITVLIDEYRRGLTPDGSQPAFDGLRLFHQTFSAVWANRARRGAPDRAAVRSARRDLAPDRITGEAATSGAREGRLPPRRTVRDAGSDRAVHPDAGGSSRGRSGRAERARLGRDARWVRQASSCRPVWRICWRQPSGLVRRRVPARCGAREVGAVGRSRGDAAPNRFPRCSGSPPSVSCDAGGSRPRAVRSTRAETRTRLYWTTRSTGPAPRRRVCRRSCGRGDQAARRRD